MGGRVLRPHVDDHPLFVGGLIRDDVVVGHHRPQLLLQPTVRFLQHHLLGALVGRRFHPRRLLGPGDPEIAHLGFLVLDGFSVAHVTLGASLNWTGTDPTA